MKSLIYILIFSPFFILSGCNDSSRQESGDVQSSETDVKGYEDSSKEKTVINPGKAMGELKFGMSRDETEKILGKPQRTMGGAFEYLNQGMAVLFDKNSQVVALMFGDMNKPDSPLVKKCHYRTDKGIGMGSSLDDIRKAYGEPASVQNMGNLKRVKYPSLGVTFSLQDGKIIHMQFRSLE